MTFTADNDVVVNRDIECCRGGDNGRCHLNVGLGWGRVTRGMIVDQNESRGTKFQCAFDDFAGIDWRMIDGA